ncbi:MAG: ATP-binding cassette domain-containing protein [Firmicutes bacterium]|nr:ATP-binding cassette domain-containing protein [Bacillota bacterium]
MALLSIETLRVAYGNHVALNITEKIDIQPGDKIGIIGSNGAGKTTFAKSICGLVNYTGKINTQLKKCDIAIHLQDNQYIGRMPVKLIIEAIFNTTISKNEKLLDIIRFFDFEPCLKKRFAQLSGGQKQKLTIILVLMQNKPLTFFDEVTSGLDFESRVKLVSKIQQWYREKDGTVCIVSHYYDELEKFVNKLLIIDNGRVIAFGDVDELFKKLCGSVIYVIENNERNDKITKIFKRIGAPSHLIALPANSKSDETKLTEVLIKEGINYKRSDKDIEILFVNAIKEVS